MQNILENITNSFTSNAITMSVIVAVLIMTLILSVYEFIVYRFVSHRSFIARRASSINIQSPHEHQKAYLYLWANA